MNYSKIHTEFIADRRANPVTAGYTERHHVIPVSMGGSDGKENLIVLTAGDHYFIHLLLAKIHGGKQWAGVYAMANLKGSSKKRNIYASRKMIEIARERMAEMSSKNAIEQHKGKEYRELMSSEEVNAKRSASLKGRISPMKGRTLSIETIKKRSESTKAYWDSKEGHEVKQEKRKAWKENNPNDNPESRAKITAGVKAYRSRPEIKARYSVRMSGDNNPAKRKEVRDKISASRMGQMSGAKSPVAKPVMCIETGIVYPTATEAGNATTASKKHIGTVCKGLRKSTGGLHWKYV